MHKSHLKDGLMPTLAVPVATLLLVSARMLPRTECSVFLFGGNNEMVGQLLALSFLKLH
jgi:hypothetical protein